MKKRKPLSMPKLVKKIDQNKAIKSKAIQKKIKIAKIVLISLGVLILISLLFTAFKKISKFLNENKFITYPIVKIQFHKPFEFVSNEDYQKQKEQEKRIEELAPYFLYRIENPDPVFSYDDITKTKEEILEEFGMEFYQTVHKYESSEGKNPSEGSLQKYCADKGLRNEVGYNPSGKQCFKSQSEEVATVINWVGRNCEDLPLSQCLCLYNEGRNKDTGLPNLTCPYSRGDLSMAN